MKKILLGILVLMAGTVFSQNTMLGIDFQAYPTGILPGIQLESFIHEQSSLTVKAGLNIVRHRDLGIHEDERGSGVGGTLGYKYYFEKSRSRWFSSFRTDIWWNKIDWKDQIGTATEISGQTKITVFQPTLMGGYRWNLNSFFLDVHISFGYELNVKTQGANVGEGAILLIGFTGSLGL